MAFLGRRANRSARLGGSSAAALRHQLSALQRSGWRRLSDEMALYSQFVPLFEGRSGRCSIWVAAGVRSCS